MSDHHDHTVGPAFARLWGIYPASSLWLSTTLSSLSRIDSTSCSWAISDIPVAAAEAILYLFSFSPRLQASKSLMPNCVGLGRAGCAAAVRCRVCHSHGHFLTPQCSVTPFIIRLRSDPSLYSRSLALHHYLLSFLRGDSARSGCSAHSAHSAPHSFNAPDLRSCRLASALRTHAQCPPELTPFAPLTSVSCSLARSALRASPRLAPLDRNN